MRQRVPEVRRVLNLDPMLCGVVVELDRLITGLGRLGHRPTRLHTAQPDRRLRSVCGRSLSATAFQPPYDLCNVAWLGDDLQQTPHTHAADAF